MWLGELLLLDIDDRVLVRAQFAATGAIFNFTSAKVAPSEAIATGVPVWFTIELSGKEMVRGQAQQVFQGSMIHVGCRVVFEALEAASST